VFVATCTEMFEGTAGMVVQQTHIHTFVVDKNILGKARVTGNIPFVVIPSALRRILAVV
jgi:hypothetical protein